MQSVYGYVPYLHSVYLDPQVFEEEALYTWKSDRYKHDKTCTFGRKHGEGYSR